MHSYPGLLLCHEKYNRAVFPLSVFTSNHVSSLLECRAFQDISLYDCEEYVLYFIYCTSQ